MLFTGSPVSVVSRSEEFPGWWWFATTGEHVGYESWLERDHLIALDADVDVTGVASQPFSLRWRDDGRIRRHVLDYFVRMRDGGAVVVDVRADDRIEPADAEAFEAAGRACESVDTSPNRTARARTRLGMNVHQEALSANLFGRPINARVAAREVRSAEGRGVASTQVCSAVACFCCEVIPGRFGSELLCVTSGPRVSLIMKWSVAVWESHGDWVVRSPWSG
ncbi:TnsA-like heteromeric transposase endonuclease subunit [Nocardia sp. BMG51109]|uniref:TnsA-like heteromeric transposase endonuclease subunit n=1 Tax=Nocardia sp. BMG51109 TaxID=1056816 RepID=UPI0004AC8BBB|nr:TnsA-like heteromeric transposase endonuclease subunit [Nocardia sp. BMG51109]